MTTVLQLVTMTAECKLFHNTDFGVCERKGGTNNKFLLIWYEPFFYENADVLSHLTNKVMPRTFIYNMMRGTSA